MLERFVLSTAGATVFLVSAPKYLMILQPVDL